MSRSAIAAFALVLAASVAVPSAAPAQVRNWPSESQPGPLAAKPVTFPAFEVRTLDNGLRVVVVEHHEQPAVSVRMLVGAGSAQDVAPKLGVANMVASLLDQGTATRSAQQIADTMDTIGGSVVVGAGTDLTFAYVTVLKDGVDECLQVLSDLVRAPAFAPAELERQREQLRSALRVSYGDPDYLATLVFKRLVYGFHPYGMPATGTPASIDRITRADLVEFHRRYFVPNNCILAVIGDIPAGDAFAAVERAFGSWERRDVTPTAFPEPPAPTRRVVVVDVPDAVQTEIRAGQLGVRRTSDDYVAMDLAVRVLGGEGANRLQQVLRVQRGLTYGASADLESYKAAGDIVAETDTRSEATGDAVRAVADEFARLHRDPPGARELDGAKAYLRGSFPLGIETPDAIATKILTALFYGLPLKQLDTVRERVNAITAADIERVSQGYLKPDRLAIVLVGNASAFASGLPRLGLGKPEVIALAELDVTTADLRRPPAPPSRQSAVALTPPLPVVSAPEWARAKEIVLRAAAAAGGLDALRAVRTIRATAKTVIPTPDGPMNVDTRTSIEYPGRLRVDVTSPRGEIVQVYKDGHAWIKDPTGAHDAPDAMKTEFAQGIRRDWIALMLAAADDRITGRPLANDTGLGGRPLQVVELWGDGLPPVRVAFDSASAELKWLSYQGSGPGGRVTITESFDDFRFVAGVEMPYVAVVRRDSVLVLERTLVEIQVNEAFPPKFFDKIQ